LKKWLKTANNINSSETRFKILKIQYRQIDCFGISERDHLGLIGNNPEEIELKYDKIDGVPCIVIYNAETYRKMIEKK